MLRSLTGGRRKGRGEFIFCGGCVSETCSAGEVYYMSAKEDAAARKERSDVSCAVRIDYLWKKGEYYQYDYE